MKKNVNRALVAKKKFSKISLTLLAGLLLTFAFPSQGWAGGSAYMSARSADPAQGLVYSATSNSTPADNKYQEYYPGGLVVGTTGTDASPANKCYYSAGSSTGPHITYAWAKPTRGYKFKGWKTGTYMTKTSDSKTNINTETDRANWNGTADIIKNSAGGKQCTYSRPVAEFEAATAYTITYAVPVGGSYHVGYSYLKTRERSTASFYDANGTANSYKDYEFYQDDSEQYDLNSSTEESYEVTSYAEDKITLTIPNEATNFIGWYEGESKISEEKTYVYTAHADVTIKPMFKELAWGDITGDVSVNVTAKGTYSSKTVYVAIPTLIGTWSSSEFNVVPTNLSNDFGSIHIDAVELNQTESRLEITYTYTASDWGGIEGTFTITPTFGAPKQFSVACFAEEVVDDEACIEENGERTYTGTLAEMMLQANSMTNKPTVKLMTDVSITTPLSFVKSMTFDANGKVLTANCASAFSIDAAYVDVQIIDGSFTQVGEIHTSYASANPVSVVTFTKAAKLTMQGGTLSAENTGAGAAYGIDVQQGSIFYMTGGDMTVIAPTDAQGVHVASSDDYATLNGGSIVVSAPANAYGLWSAGQSNITDATIDVTATTGASAYGVYVNGGTTTVTTTNFVVNAKTTNAYGANVNVGRLNFNGGELNVSAEISDVYGVYVGSSATAMLQQNAKVTAETTGASGTNVIGINNLGTVTLNNISVTATSATNYATAVNSITSAVSTTIEGGTYTANTETGYAYGLHHQYGALDVDGGTFKGIVKTSGANAYGVRVVDNATIANATMLGETRGSGNTAYGFVGGVANKTITLTNCDITGKSNTNKAYAIYSRTNVSASGCTLTATTLDSDQAYGFYAENGTNGLANCNVTVTANSVKAYGINHVAGAMTINGGTFTVSAKQITADAAQNSELYGLYNAASQTTNVTNATFTVSASNAAYSQNVYGAYINGTLNSTGATYAVQAKLNVFGVWGNTTSNLNLKNNTISPKATNGTKSYGIYAKKNFTIDGDVINAQASTTDVYAMYFDASSVGEVKDGKFSAIGNGTNAYGAINAAGLVEKVLLKGGIYKTMTNLKKYLATSHGIYNLDDTHPNFADGYRYTIATENPSPYVCKIVGGAHYTTLEAALQYTKDNTGTYTIVMTQPYTLPEGEYELPSNATLLVPYKTEQTAIQGANPIKRNIAGLIEEHLCLTFAAGAHLNVNGKIEVGGELYCVESGKISYNNSPYARIHLESGSVIQLNHGSYLYAWGFITGTGEIKAKNGSEVHEMFQIGDMKAMSPLVQKYNNNSYKFFPLNQYYIQNIEAPTTYYYNSKLICAFSNYYTGSYNGDNNIKLIGTSDALFLITSNKESSWVRKWYDASTDYQIWEVNSDVTLGSLSLSVSGYSFNSSKYILPVTSNMKIHALDGDFAISQSSQFLPGSELEINKTASLVINPNQKVYIFDKDQWPTSAGNTNVVFSPSWANGKRPSRTIKDVALNVHGTIKVEGSLYTSNKGSETSKTDGANIYSNNDDAGTISFSSSASSATTITLMTSADATKEINMDPARLKNGDGTYTTTAGAVKDLSFVYMNNAWAETYDDGCFKVIGATYYANPSEYVALKNGKTANDDHTYTTIEEKLLICQSDCQWWEVEATTTAGVFECKKEGYEGFYSYNETAGEWQLVKRNVTFYLNEEKTSSKVVSVNYMGVPDQSVIATNPTKAQTAEYTYTFYGWKSSVDPYNEYAWTATLEPAENDMYYTPVFTATKRKYTITFKDANNGADVPVETAYGELPSYTPVKEPTAQYTYTFTGWTPELVTVTGPASYTANWDAVVNLYTVIFKDGEQTLQTKIDQPYGTVTTFAGVQPTKEADDEFVYTFDGWVSSVNGTKYNNGNTPTVSGDVTYTAHYATIPRYMITFVNYDGEELQKSAVTQGTAPVFNGTPRRDPDRDGYFRFKGWKNSNGYFSSADAVLPAADKKETYTAQFEYITTVYTITFKNFDGNNGEWSNRFGEEETPSYDGTTPLGKASTIDKEYTLDYWLAASDSEYYNDPLPAVTKDETYTAVWAESARQYTITWVDGNGNTLKEEQVAYGTTPAYTGATPTKAEDAQYTYTFNGWTPAIATVSADATYMATYTETKKSYTLTWNLDGGTITTAGTTAGSVEWGTSLTAPVVEKAGYDFAAWNPAVDVTMPEKDVTYTATWTPGSTTYLVEYYKLHIENNVPFKQRYSFMEYPAQTGDVVTPEPIEIEGYDTPEPQTVTVAGDGSTEVKYYYQISKDNTLNADGEITTKTEAYTVVLAPGKTMNITGAGSVTAQNLVLQSVPGDNTGANLATTDNLKILGDVCIEIDMNKSGKMNDKLFYCFSVPFNVNVSGGVTRLNKNNGQWESAVLNTNYRVYTYSESDRATKGPQDSNWTPFNGPQFAPGVFYLCEFDNSNYNRYRFYAADKDLDNKENIAVSNSNTSSEEGGWNGVANNGLTNNQLSGDFTYIQTLNSEGNSFESAKADEKPLAIGNAAMVQVSESGSVVVGETSSAVAARRMGETASTEFINVRLYKENQNQHVDQIFIRASEDAAEQYVAGIDLSKATMGTPKVARMWVNDYDLQLVANEARMNNNQAIFSLGMSAPANGEYTIALDETPADAIVYLTMNGSAIWNLNIAPAPISLSKGTENSYGLRLVRKINNVVTGFDEAVLNGNVQKVILNDHLYIIRDGKVYSAHGHVIK